MHPKNTLYSIAWGMIEAPVYRSDKELLAIFDKRIELISACRTYATMRGWRLEFWHTPDRWRLHKRVEVKLEDGAETMGWRCEFEGTLQQCCLKIVEDDETHPSPLSLGWEDSPTA